MKPRMVYRKDISYPDLQGMRVMLMVPNDYYRKKLFGLSHAYVAQAMRRCGIDVSVLSCDIWSYDDIEIAKIIIESGIKIFAIGALFPMVREVERLCRLIRSLVPGATIILGGAHVTPIPEFILTRTKADIAVIGEADFTIPLMMRALAEKTDLGAVPGIAFFQDNVFVHTGQPLIPAEITREEIGWPAWDLFPIESYLNAPKFPPYEQSDRVMSILSGRGCPFSCNFCYRTCAFRVRPVSDVLDEMEHLIDRYKLNGFYFLDDLVMLNRKRIAELCDGILDRGMRIKFNVAGRANIVDPEIIRKLKAAGCISIFYGVESGDQAALDAMKKKITVEQARRAVALTREAGIFCWYGIMFGQPGETAETLSKTVSLIKDLSYGRFFPQQIFGCIPFPGTQLYEHCKQHGLIRSDADFYEKYTSQDWSLAQLPINMTALSDADANALFKQANQELSAFNLKRLVQEWPRAFRPNLQVEEQR